MLGSIGVPPPPLHPIQRNIQINPFMANMMIIVQLP